MRVIKLFLKSRELWTSLLLNVVMVVLINNSMAIGYLLGTILTTSYRDETEIIKPNPFHVFGCLLGIAIGLFIKVLFKF